MQLQVTTRQDISLHCENLHCSDSNHSEYRDNHVVDILGALIKSSHLTLPTYGGCKVGHKRSGLSTEYTRVEQ